MVDNDWRSGTFASWLGRSEWCSWADPDRIEAFWRDQGFASVQVESEWRFQRRQDLEAVLGVAFPPPLAEGLCREHRAPPSRSTIASTIGASSGRPRTTGS